MTASEWDLYIQICRSYDNGTQFKGENLFVDLFESTDDGQIVFLRPPNNRHTSLEVVIYIQNLMVQQAIRRMQNQINKLCDEFKEKFAKIIENNNKQTEIKNEN